MIDTNSSKDPELELQRTDELALAPDEKATARRADPARRRAELWVDGLSVFGFHTRKGYAEIAFIEPDHSSVEMRIYKNGCYLFWSTERDYRKPTEGLIITVNSTKPGEEGTYYCDGLKPPGDSEDFCHMLNVAHLFGQPNLPYTEAFEDMLTARLRVHDGLFFTKQLSRRNAIVLRDGQEISRKRIGRILGADLVCSPDEDLTIEIAERDGAPPASSIPLKGPDRYEILVRTKAENDHNHFHHVFHVLETPAGSTSTFDARFDDWEPQVPACDDGPSTKGPPFICESVTGAGD